MSWFCNFIVAKYIFYWNTNTGTGLYGCEYSEENALHIRRYILIGMRGCCVGIVLCEQFIAYAVFDYDDINRLKTDINKFITNNNL